MPLYVLISIVEISQGSEISLPLVSFTEACATLKCGGFRKGVGIIDRQGKKPIGVELKHGCIWKIRSKIERKILQIKVEEPDIARLI